jgi:hypothetical protein
VSHSVENVDSIQKFAILPENIFLTVLINHLVIFACILLLATFVMMVLFLLRNITMSLRWAQTREYPKNLLQGGLLRFFGLCIYGLVTPALYQIVVINYSLPSVRNISTPECGGNFDQDPDSLVVAGNTTNSTIIAAIVLALCLMYPVVLVRNLRKIDDFYETVRRYDLRIIWGPIVMDYTKDMRMWDLVKWCYTAILSTVVGAFAYPAYAEQDSRIENVVRGYIQLGVLIIVQAFYTGLLVWKKPYRAAIQQRFMVLFHGSRVVLLLAMLVVAILVSQSSDLSVANAFKAISILMALHILTSALYVIILGLRVSCASLVRQCSHVCSKNTQRKQFVKDLAAAQVDRKDGDDSDDDELDRSESRMLPDANSSNVPVKTAAKGQAQASPTGVNLKILNQDVQMTVVSSAALDQTKSN